MKAKFVFEVKVTHLPAAYLVQRLSSISLQPDMDGYAACNLLNPDGSPMLEITSDNTEAAESSTVVRRIVEITYGAHFIAQFPTTRARQDVLFTTFGIGILRAGMTGEVTSEFSELET